MGYRHVKSGWWYISKPKLISILLIISLKISVADNFADTNSGEINIENEELLMTTDNCKIPKLNINFRDDRPTPACPRRGVYINKISNNKITFFKKEHHESCCYNYIHRSNNRSAVDFKVRQTPCLPFSNNTSLNFTSEFIRVKCVRPKLYEDFYGLVKKYEEGITEHRSKERSWNVLLLGMDTMSRARAHSSLRRTVDYFRKNHWLDFRGYNKMAKNTRPNLAAVLSGKNIDLFKKTDACSELSRCNNLLIWHQFKKGGYVTAFGEDSLYMGGTFQHTYGFNMPPTHHYMRPLFMGGESRKRSGLTCIGRITTGQQILDYILDYGQTYKDKKYFGFFWVSSFSHDLDTSPKWFDEPLQKFFKKVKSTGIIKNTFVIFFSDHGIRFGPVRYPIASYYQQRLPMLFIWVPKTFRKTYPDKYSNLITNQQRLVSPYDLYLTLWDLLKTSNGIKTDLKASGCRRCTSMFNKMPMSRSCSDAGIAVQWCACGALRKASLREYGAMRSMVLSAEHIHQLPRSIPTKPCTSCRLIYLKKILRVHSYSINNNTYYVVALLTVPGDVIFESQVRKYLKRGNDTYDLLSAVRLTETPGTTNKCVKDFEFRYFCACESDKQCLLRYRESKQDTQPHCIMPK